MITITAFGQLPPFAQGLSRDLRLRWALEEAGLPYRVDYVGLGDQTGPHNRALQPFGQVPSLCEGDLTVFESGAIVHHIALKSPNLMPADADGQARTLTWMFAALNTMEVAIQQLAEIDLFGVGKDLRPQREDAVKRRLSELAERIGDGDYLEDRFTVADLLMVTVLQVLRHTQLVEAEPVLKAYKARCEARPAFQRAYRDHMATFEKA